MADDKLRKVFESAAKTGSFGENFSVVDVVLNEKESKDQFASDVIFAQVKLENGSIQKNVSVVIKKQQQDGAVREMMSCDCQFYNEHLMYSEIMPFLERDDILKDMFPTYYYSFATLGENFEQDIVVVEDLNHQGFVLSKEKVFLDFDHCVLALKALGKFHALSYIMKQKNREEFFKKVGKLKEAVNTGPDLDEDHKMMISCLERGFVPLIEAGEHVSVLKGFLERVTDPSNYRLQLCRPEEPFAVLCHGDFNRNNMLFQYNKEGKPVAVRFFDVATSMYASPAIDLSFFLFMNTTSELRAAHWDDLLEVYHQSLSSTAPNCPLPSLAEVHGELKKKGVYGLLICSFFLPMMMDNPSKEDLEMFMNMPFEEMLEMTKTQGGEEVTRAVSDIVRDLVKIGAF